MSETTNDLKHLLYEDEGPVQVLTPPEWRACGDSMNCLRCEAVIPYRVGNGLCDGCDYDEREAEWERNRGPQTLADVGMSQADFWMPGD